jgi:divalent metal cation (Fe/Co/Zn/Cd) transporter
MSTATLCVVPTDLVPPARAEQLRRAFRLEVFSVAWSVFEGGVAVAAAIAAGSVVLLGFGADSFVESASAVLMLWRLVGERRLRDHRDLERIETRARRLTALSLMLLAGYVAIDAVHALVVSERPRFSAAGAVLLVVSMTLMMALARAKRRTAAALGSRALAADAFQTTACWWLSAIALAGIGLNALWGWWWADPVAALGAAVLIAKEGGQAWRGEETCCSHRSHLHAAGEVHSWARARPLLALVPVPMSRDIKPVG